MIDGRVADCATAVSRSRRGRAGALSDPPSEPAHAVAVAQAAGGGWTSVRHRRPVQAVLQAPHDLLPPHRMARSEAEAVSDQQAEYEGAGAEDEQADHQRIPGGGT